MSSVEQPVYQDVVDSLPYVDNDLEAIPGASAAPARLERRRRRRPSEPSVRLADPRTSSHGALNLPGLREQAEALVYQELSLTGGVHDEHERLPAAAVNEAELFKVRLLAACRAVSSEGDQP
jgi:hypothetical protein